MFIQSALAATTVALSCIGVQCSNPTPPPIVPVVVWEEDSPIWADPPNLTPPTRLDVQMVQEDRDGGEMGILSPDQRCFIVLGGVRYYFSTGICEGVGY